MYTKLEFLKKMRGNLKTGQFVQLWFKKKQLLTNRLNNFQNISNTRLYEFCRYIIKSLKTGCKEKSLKSSWRLKGNYTWENNHNDDSWLPLRNDAKYSWPNQICKLLKRKRKEKANLDKFYIQQKYYLLWRENKDIFTHRMVKEFISTSNRIQDTVKKVLQVE